jgi:hypothetical protein
MKSPTIVFQLPSFDTGHYEGCEFLISGGGAKLSVHVSGLPDVVISFHRVRWHQFTANYNCTAEMVREAYFRLVEYPSSPAVARFIQEDSASAKAYKSLSHFRIFLDETGCHEVYAESARAL